MIVCSCHHVTDRDVAAACAAGARRIGAVVRATCAGTDCGGCIPRLRATVEQALSPECAVAHTREVARAGLASMTSIAV